MIPKNAKKIALKAAKEAGKILSKYYKRELKITFKSRRDIVTQADIQAEKKIVAILRKEFPDHNFVTEESDKIENGSDYSWVIDPLDGTTNFAHKHPFFCTSIGLVKGDEPILGVVFAPISGELFYAEKGKGAYLNNKKISVSKVDKLINSLVATGFPYRNKEVAKLNIQNLNNLWDKVRGLRRDGAAALDLCQVACGRYDLFFEYELKPWDICAGIIIVKEAKGKVTNFFGKNLSVWETDVVATNSLIHKTALKKLKQRKK